MGARSTALTHRRLWAAIDTIAEVNGLSASALARRAGLSSTAFNKSKRETLDGRLRWPSTESIAKILEATETDLADLIRLVAEPTVAEGDGGGALPVLAAASIGGFAEASTTASNDLVAFPGADVATLFAFRIVDAGAAPLYRIGDVLVACRASPIRRGDRVLVHTLDGATSVRLFLSRNGRSSEFAVPAGRRRRLRLPTADVLWIARILWASQ